MSVGSNSSGIDQLNFDEYEDDDDERKSGNNMYNLREYEDQNSVLTNQDVVSIDDIFLDNSDVHAIELHDVYQYQTEIGGTFLAEHSRPNVLQDIMLMSDALFGVIHYESGL